MRQLKTLFLGVILLTFVGGLGAGAWVGSLLAEPVRPAGLDRRVEDFQRLFDLDATQVRDLRTILAEFDDRNRKIRQLTPEQWKEVRTLEQASIERIRGIMTDVQRREYDKLIGR